MKQKSFFISAFFLAILLLTSCSDDESSKSTQFFKADGKTTSLQGAKLYLVTEYFAANRTIRGYFISDGNYDGSGFSFNDFTDATYVMAILISMADEADFAPGNFHAIDGDAMVNFPDYSVVHFEFETDEISYVTPEMDLDGGGFVKISGDFNDGDTMTIEFKNIRLDGFDGTSGTLHFKGIIDDQRPD